MLRILGVIAVAFALGASVGAALLVLSRQPGPPPPPVAAERIKPAWNETSWPFLLDEWGRGRAFQCRSADCGAEVMVYVRPKLGFCNCTTGVADDDELARVGDLGLLGKVSELAAGRPIAVATMKGRSRPYAVGGAGDKSALAIAFNERCDAVVATAVIANPEAPRWEPAVIAFLNSEVVLRWVEKTLGL